MNDKKYVTGFKLTRFDTMNSVDGLVDKIVSETMQKSSELTEKVLLDQLTELVKRDLLVIEETTPSIHRIQLAETEDAWEFRMVKGIRLVLKNQEYVEKLEKENLELTNQLIETNKKLDDFNEKIQNLIVAMETPKE